MTRWAFLSSIYSVIKAPDGSKESREADRESVFVWLGRRAEPARRCRVDKPAHR